MGFGRVLVFGCALLSLVGCDQIHDSSVAAVEKANELTNQAIDLSKEASERAKSKLIECTAAIELSKNSAIYSTKQLTDFSDFRRQGLAAIPNFNSIVNARTLELKNSSQEEIDRLVRGCSL